MLVYLVAVGLVCGTCYFRWLWDCDWVGAVREGITVTVLSDCDLIVDCVAPNW